jgi:hypothetical protein
MKKLTFAVLITIPLLFSHLTRADEGMWMVNLLKQLDYGELTEKGLKLDAQDIYSINRSSLKDAIVIFGGGCTGEMISGQGLLLTNMHCGYGRIQSHSTVENDYLKNGFWAQSMDDELPNPGLSVRFLKRIEDVTDQVLGRVDPGMSETERQQRIRQITNKLEEEAEEGTHHSATVRPFYEGNQYYMMVYETYEDVRLVASPPTSIGDFGSLTDNWMWPRHKADFAIFRVYMSPEGKPADYSPDNVPYQPKHHLPVSVKGVEEGDFAMIMGYPGNTDRFMTSYGIRELQEVEHPNRIKIRGKKLEIMNKIMNRSPEHRIMYASKYKGTSNYWKYSIGQMEGFKRIDLLSKRKKLERNFIQWINGRPEREEKYGNTLDMIQQAYEQRREFENAGQYLRETMLYGPEVMRFARSARKLEQLLDRSFLKSLFKGKDLRKEVKRLREQGRQYFRDYHRPTDLEIAQALWKMLQADIDQRFYPEALKRYLDRHQGDVSAVAVDVFANSIFTDPNRFEGFLDDPDLDQLRNDPAYVLSASAYDKYYQLRARSSQYDNQLQKGQRLFVKGVMEMQPEKTFYPDANFTMRLTYGKVGGYPARDAVKYQYHTTLEGVMEKEDPDNYEFIVPDKLKKLYSKKDYGRYGDNGQMPVCFITDNDITGGNSGSPVMNGEGELIGLAFDSNWEGMTGDIEYEEGMQKTVCTDIRYLLFILDKYGEVDWLIEEMDLVN